MPRTETTASWRAKNFPIWPLRARLSAGDDTMAVSELICQLSSALDGGNQEAEFAVLQALAGLLNNPRADEASEMDEILMDAWPLLMAATAQSVAADAAARPVLAALARHCTAREVFTLCMAALAENLR